MCSVQHAQLCVTALTRISGLHWPDLSSPPETSSLELNSVVQACVCVCPQSWLGPSLLQQEDVTETRTQPPAEGEKPRARGAALVPAADTTPRRADASAAQSSLGAEEQECLSAEWACVDSHPVRRPYGLRCRGQASYPPSPPGDRRQRHAPITGAN